jgi:hypothetical protein
MKKIGLFMKLLATGTLTMLLAACYGTIQVMYGVPYSQRSGIIKVQNSDTPPSPIPDIKVTFYSTVLDANQLPDSSTWQFLREGPPAHAGSLLYTEYLDDHELLLAKLEDIDDELNGGPYATQVIILEGNGTVKTVTMVEDEPTEDIAAKPEEP